MRIATSVLTVLMALVGCTSLGLSGAAPVEGGSSATKVLVASPGGGGDCSDNAPCTVPVALARALEGDRIALSSGRYSSLTLPVRPASASWTRNITIQPRAGADATLSDMHIYTSHVTLRDITLTGTLYLHSGADQARLERVHVKGSGVFVRASHVQVVDSLLEGGDRIDGLQIAGYPRRNEDIMVTGTTVRGYTQNGRDVSKHADCIQLFDTKDITIQGNQLANCYGSAVITSPGGGLGLTNVRISNNFIQGCVVRTRQCGGGSALDARVGDHIIVEHNTVLDGSFRLSAKPGNAATANIIDYLSNCDAPLKGNLIGNWNHGLCRTTPGGPSNRTGTATVVDRPSGDLRLTNPTSPDVTFAPDTTSPTIGSYKTYDPH